MPSDQRLHPATLLFELAKHVKQFALPALLVIVGASRSSGGDNGIYGRLPDGWEAWLLVLFVPAALASIARYLSFRLRYDGDQLVIRSGLVFRNERNIPFSRIQNVDAVQNVVHRLLGVVEVRIETGGGKEEEARLSVLPRSAFEELRSHVFQQRAPREESTDAAGQAARGETLVHLPLRELLLCGFLENKGMVLIGAAYGALWETGIAGSMGDYFVEGAGAASRGFFRDLIRAIAGGGELPLARIGIALAGVAVFLIVVRIVSMIWALVRLYDFRLTRVGEDLRSEYGLFMRVTATVPIRRVQTVTVRAGLLHRWLERASVRVATAGGASLQSASRQREWLAPLIHQRDLPQLLQQVLPGFDLDAVAWQPLHPRAFARAVKPSLITSTVITLLSALVIGWSAAVVWILMLAWSIVTTRQYVAHLRWAEGNEVVMLRSGWIRQQLTIARANKIQVVALHQSPFDRRAAMARVRVDTAGATELSHRVDIPYLDHDIARGLAGRLSAAAANTAFRW